MKTTQTPVQEPVFRVNGKKVTPGKKAHKVTPTPAALKGFKSKVRYGWIPAMLVIFVTFALSLAAAKSIATLLQMWWLFPFLLIGFAAAEFMVISWIFEPQKGYYTKDQLRLVEAAKWVVMGAGLIDGVLLIIGSMTGNESVAMAAVQAGVSLTAIFFSAGASMQIIKNDPERLVAVDTATVNKRIAIEENKVRLQTKQDELKALQLQVRTNDKARVDLANYAIQALNSSELQSKLQEEGARLALGIVEQYSARITRILAAKAEGEEQETPGKPKP